MNALIYALAHTLHSVISLYIWVVIIASLLTFVQIDPDNQIVQILRRLTDPVFSFVREKMPFVVFSGIDLSPVVILFSLELFDAFMVRALLG